MNITDLCIDGEEYCVIFDYNKACRGAREKGSGVQLEPDEGPSADINQVYLWTDNHRELLPQDKWPSYDRMEEMIIEHMEGEY
jgi:hypothetical protein